MENTKKLLRYSWMALLAIAALTFNACKDDDDPAVAGAPTIVVTPTTASNLPGKTISIGIALTGDAGLASLTVNGTNIKTYTTEKTDAITYDYVVPNDAAVGNTIALEFTVTDKQSPAQTAKQITTVTVGDPGKATEVIQGAIKTSMTFSKDKYYLLKGNVYVQAPAELTIEAGTIVFGDKVTKGALIINRGAKIHAVGTESSPIVFTSSAPANYRNYGDWGGVVLLGKAVNNQGATWTIEGVSGNTGDDGQYGGTDDDDNSGELQYARIEFAGIALTTDNELNGLTMGSVGTGTKLDHIQVSYSGDDSFEWFGGKVSAKYLIAYRGWDDDFDTDFGYRGMVQYGVAHRDPNIGDKSGSNGFESDNDGSGSAAADHSPVTNPKFSNMTWYGPGVYAKLAGTSPNFTLNKSAYNGNYQFGGHLRRNSAIQIYNSVFVGSFLEGVHFDKTNFNGAFKGNYFARTAINIANNPVKKVTNANADGDIDLSTFDADNYNTTGSQTAVDQSTVIAGLGLVQQNIDQPLSLLAAGSSLLTGAKAVPAGLETTTYIGAFDAANDWTKATWVNFNPSGTQY